MLADFSDDLEAAAIRQAKIENDDIGFLNGKRPQRFRGVFGGHHVMPHCPQTRPQKPENRRLVVDHEHGICVSHLPRPDGGNALSRR